MVVFNEQRRASSGRDWRRMWRKVLRIGPLGALIGYRMRDWFRQPGLPDLLEVAARHGIPVTRIRGLRDPSLPDLIRRADVDLGLSLSNGYIPRAVFQAPRWGMINVHGELLPRFKGAASVIWAIHEGANETGFTIHRIDEGIDTGPIIYREAFPIQLKPTLKETVAENCAIINQRLPAALVKVIAEYSTLAGDAVPQEGGGKFTTPTAGQFWRMLRQHKRMLRESSTRPS